MRGIHMYIYIYTTYQWRFTGSESSGVLRSITPKDTSLGVSYRTHSSGRGTVVMALGRVEERGAAVASVSDSILVYIWTRTRLEGNGCGLQNIPVCRFIH